MERIIIQEVDNTSNVEALSSYDVVYVPGFANNGASPVFSDGKQSLFRNPTLVKNKYEFVSLYGDMPPIFTKDQPYPIASKSSDVSSDSFGFPSYAIPGYVPPATPDAVEGLNKFYISGEPAEVIAAIEDSDYYEAPANMEPRIPDNQWEPVEEITYYEAVKDGEMYTMSALHPWTESNTGHTAGKYDGKLLFVSSTNPNALGWKVKFGDTYSYTSDEALSFEMNGGVEGVVKTYYVDGEGQPAMMFYGHGEAHDGDADPGYRYAYYLLSLGIPVYYEQMNAEFAQVDTDDPATAALSPKAEGWFIKVDGDYIRSTDPAVKHGVDYFMGADISVDSMYRGLEARFFADEESIDYSFDSMGDYAVKYLTTGGYPIFEFGPLGAVDTVTNVAFGTSPIAQAMIKLAAKRGDALALIDHTNNPFRSIYETDTFSVVSRARYEFAGLDTIDGSFGTLFTPWYMCTHKAITGGKDINNSFNNQMPASLAYLSALAQQLRNYNPWLAVSGVSRGVVPYCGGLHTNFNLTNNVADSYQMLPGDTEALGSSVISINPITRIRNYGYCLWGNRTLRDNSSTNGGTKASSFLNIRNMVADIKKTLYDASLSLMFEQNTDILWINFKSLITPLLDTMVSNYILSDYKITRYLIDPESGTAVPAYKVLANIKIVPIYSVEVFSLDVTLENGEISVAETE